MNPSRSVVEAQKCFLKFQSLDRAIALAANAAERDVRFRKWSSIMLMADNKIDIGGVAKKI